MKHQQNNSKVKNRISKLEKLIKTNLPDSFKEYLEVLETQVEYFFNAELIFDFTDLNSELFENPKVFPQTYKYKIPKSKSYCYLCNVYGLHDVFGIYRIDQVIKESGLNKYLIPFADNGSGDYVCVAIDKGNYGKIFIWSHELQDKNNELAGLIFVANDFVEFIKGLKRG